MKCYKRFFLPLAWGLACFAMSSCVPRATLISQWNPAFDMNSKQGPWAQTFQLGNQDFLVQATNDDTYLYLLLATSSDAVKSQLLGAFHQTLTLWFDPGLHKHFTKGVQLIYHHMPGVGFPSTDGEQKEYWQAETREVVLLDPQDSGYPKPLAPETAELDWKADMQDGELKYVIKIPLKALSEGGWNLGAKPGQWLGISLTTSRVEMQAAILELEREYAEEKQGWGWGLNGYGPKPDGIGRGRAFGLGDYDDWGLDNSIYATHGMYGHLGLDSIPQPLEMDSRLWIAPRPTP